MTASDYEAALRKFTAYLDAKVRYASALHRSSAEDLIDVARKLHELGLFHGGIYGPRDTSNGL